MIDVQSAPPPDPETRSEPTIFQVLAARARRASDGRLALDASVGVVALLSLPFVRPLLWGLVLPFVVVGAYGLWGIADRELTAEHSAPPAPDAQPSRKRGVLVFLRRLALVVGTGAAVVGAALFMVMVLGDFIS